MTLPMMGCEFSMVVLWSRLLVASNSTETTASFKSAQETLRHLNPLLRDYRSLLSKVNKAAPASQEHPEVEDASVAIIEQLVGQIDQQPEIAPAPPAHLTGRLTNALECSVPTLLALAKLVTGESRRMAEITAQAQQDLVATCRGEAKLGETLGYNWRSREDTTTRGEKGLRIDSDEVSLLAWFPYGIDAEGPARAHASVRRMLACMRACEGIDTELLESLDPGELDAAVNDGSRDPSHPMLGR
jgi:hypothetical protein